MDEGESSPGQSWRPVVLAWLFISVLTGAPYLRAALDPPPGRQFVGFFYFVDDAYNYLSFVQQAEEGAFLFRNKLVAEAHPPALANLEWWAVGRLSAALGRRPLIAYRVFAMLAALVFVAALDRVLVRAGLPESHRLPALVFVCLAGGLGAVLFHFAGRSWQRCLDLGTGLFPFVELLANPHFVIGTALLLWALLQLSEPGLGAQARGVLLGSVVGLVRPYDLVLLVAIRAGSATVTTPWRSWLKELLPLAAFAPVALYNYWLFYRNPAFAFYQSAAYVFPTREDFIWALGPAALLAAAGLAAPPRGAAVRPVRAQMLLWVLLGLVVVAARPVNFSLQFLVGLGVPLLVLGALALSRFRPGVTLVAAALAASSSGLGLYTVMSRNPHWYAPSERLQAAAAHRPTCRPGDVALAPADIGLYLGGYSSCRPIVSHQIGPDYPAAMAVVQAFYGSGDPRARAELLDEHCVTHVVLPPAGPVPEAWLGPSSPFRLVALAGRPPAVLGVYARPAPVGPVARPCRW